MQIAVVQQHTAHSYDDSDGEDLKLAKFTASCFFYFMVNSKLEKIEDGAARRLPASSGRLHPGRRRLDPADFLLLYFSALCNETLC